MRKIKKIEFLLNVFIKIQNSATTNALKNTNYLNSVSYEKSSFWVKTHKLLYLSCLCNLIAMGNH
jgi:hypothetical protein